jgi:hypothetical protein
MTVFYSQEQAEHRHLTVEGLMIPDKKIPARDKRERLKKWRQSNAEAVPDCICVTCYVIGNSSQGG